MEAGKMIYSPQHFPVLYAYKDDTGIIRLEVKRANRKDIFTLD